MNDVWAIATCLVSRDFGFGRIAGSDQPDTLVAGFVLHDVDIGREFSFQLLDNLKLANDLVFLVQVFGWRCPPFLYYFV
jgi:hypothetical protein